MDVVGVQPHALDPAGRPDQPVVGLVQRHGLDVGHHRVLVAADAIEGVRRHMHQMAGGRRQQGQTLSIGQGAVRIVRPFGQVNIQVNGAGIVRLDLQGVLQNGHGPRHGRIRRLALVVPPIVLGLQHPGVGRNGRHRDVVGMALGDPVHGAGEPGRPALLAARIALDQGIDHLALHRRRIARQSSRLARHAQAGRQRVRIGPAAVQVRPDGPGLAPGAHAAAGVQHPRLAEGAHRFRVLERPAQPHPIVKPGLGLRVGGVDLEPLVAEAREHHHISRRLDIADRAHPAADLRIVDQGQGRRRRGRIGHRDRRDQTGDRNRRDPQPLAHCRLPRVCKDIVR